MAGVQGITLLTRGRRICWSWQNNQDRKFPESLILDELPCQPRLSPDLLDMNKFRFCLIWQLMPRNDFLNVTESKLLVTVCLRVVKRKGQWGPKLESWGSLCFAAARHLVKSLPLHSWKAMCYSANWSSSIKNSDRSWKTAHVRNQLRSCFLPKPSLPSEVTR